MTVNAPYMSQKHSSATDKDRIVCVCESFYLLHIDYQNTHSTSKVRTCLGSEEALADPHNFKGLFKGLDLVLGLGLELGIG